MTEDEWLKCTEPEPMWELVQERMSERKQRLVAVAAANLVWDRMPSPMLHEAIRFAEERAEGLVNDKQVELFRQRFIDYIHHKTKDLYKSQTTRRLLGLVVGASPHVTWKGFSWIWRRGTLALGNEQLIPIIRDIVGPLPFRPVLLEIPIPATILAFTNDIYNNRDFTQMPALADILEEKGCTNDDILGHLRAAGPHVRGCWVTDLILGKA